MKNRETLSRVNRVSSPRAWQNSKRVVSCASILNSAPKCTFPSSDICRRASLNETFLPFSKRRWNFSLYSRTTVFSNCSPAETSARIRESDTHNNQSDSPLHLFRSIVLNSSRQQCNKATNALESKVGKTSYFSPSEALVDCREQAFLFYRAGFIILLKQSVLGICVMSSRLEGSTVRQPRRKQTRSGERSLRNTTGFNIYSLIYWMLLQWPSGVNPCSSQYSITPYDHTSLF